MALYLFLSIQGLMNAPPEAEYRLIGDIYDAALDARLWPRVLQQLAELSESNSAIITALDTLNPDYTLAFTYNIPEHAVRAYREAGLDAFEMEFHGRPMMRDGLGSTLLSTEVYGSQDEYVRRGGAFYERCLKPSNIYYLAATLLDYGDFRWSALGIHRPEGWPALTRVQAALLGRVAPHVRRALQIHRQLVSVNRQNVGLHQLLDSLSVGVLLLGQNGGVRYANNQAEVLLRGHSSLITRRGLFQASDPAENAQLQRLITDAIAMSRRDSVREAAGCMCLQQSGQQLMLSVVPLSELASDDIAAAIFLTDPCVRYVLGRHLLKSAYRLTERECDICETFANTATLECTANSLGLSLSSVRTYIKDIYAKTGQRSQAELMRLLMGLRINFDHIR